MVSTFFEIIRKVKKSTPLNPVSMSMREWYKFLLEENMTMRDIDDEGRKELVPCRVETSDNNYLWSEAYRLSRLRGLTPLEKSNLFCLVHELLPANERVHHIIPATSPVCTQCEENLDESYMHCFFTCISHREATAALLHCVQAYDQDLDAERCLRLDIRACDPFTLPVMVCIATGLSLVWSNRKLKKTTTQWAMRAELEAKLQLLRKCRTRRLREAGNIINNMLENFFK